MAAGLGLLLVLVLWIGFAPTVVGGSTSYAIIDGTSMEPKLHAGDLAVVRRGGSYGVGDVVAYRNHDIGKAVLHRIVHRADGRFVFKGDNNDFLDDARPTQRDTIGRLWFRIPRIGAPVAWLKQPGHTVFVALLLLLGVAWSVSAAPARRRRRRGGGRVRAQAALRTRLAEVASSERGEGNGVAILVCLGAGLLLLGLIAFTKDSSVTRKLDSAYSQTASLSYSAQARPGVTYPAAHVATGQPVFAKLAQTVDFRFSYRFDAAGAHRASGRAGAVATLSDGVGWSRVLPLAAARTFAGDDVALRGSLDLERLAKLVRGFEVETGTAVRDYGVTIAPSVTLRGDVAGQQVDERFAPKVEFFFDGLRLAPKRPGLGQFQRHKTGSLTIAESAKVSLLGVRVGVQPARAIGLVGGVLALFAAAMLGGWMRPGSRGAAPLLVSSRHAHLIVPLAEPKEIAGASVAEVASIDSLVELAERYDRLILHEPGPGLGSYLVEDDGVVYRYRPPLPKPSANGYATAAAPLP